MIRFAKIFRPLASRLLPLALLPLLFTSCYDEGNWFSHPVKFTGEVEASRMVLTGVLYAGQRPELLLNTSYFFLDTLSTEVVEVTHQSSPNSDPYTYTTTRARRGYIDDALVEMQVDGGEWEKLRVERRKVNLYADNSTNTAYVEEPFYTSDRILLPGQTVSIRASHPDFAEEASVTQRIPSYPGAELSFLRVDSFPNAMSYSTSKLAVLSLTVAPYTADTTDMLCLRATSYQTRREIYGPDAYDYPDTTILYPLEPEDAIYSNDYSFAAYDIVNEPLSYGHYGARSLGLFRQANTTSSPLTMTLWTDYVQYEYAYEYGDLVSDYTTDSIVVEVLSVSRDAYLHASSITEAGYYHKYLNDYWGSSESTGQDIIDEIMEIFDELGGMEGVQVFSNVEGAFGHVTAAATERLVIICN